MPLHVIGPIFDLPHVVGDALLQIKDAFSSKERARLRALGRGQVGTAIFLGIVSWVLFLADLGYIVSAVLEAS